ncbi:MAG: nitrilase-related carbon-nitrogen hydrolase, partial [Gammaproteobacteria bacterium]|nr:nitrilase-related carbon-nitrogen hydrolase [Gammaproteobacteria bacterium]
MADQFCLVMGQINPVVGDVAGNVKKIVKAAEQAKADFNADLVVFPELTLTGYPPEDLLLRPGLIKRVNKGLKTLKKKIKTVAVLVGYPSGTVGSELYNTASLIADGHCLATYYKQYLPNYSVFDEKRYFVEGCEPCVINYKDISFGITICEDIWFTAPAAQAAHAGAEIILNLNASPFRQGKGQLRENELQKRTLETGLPIVYVNQIGGQDELVFDGGSFALDAHGNKVAHAARWQQGLFPIMVSRRENGMLSLQGEIIAPPDNLAMIYQALVCGIRDYVQKNHFSSVVLGLSGGIDSALTLALA